MCNNSAATVERGTACRRAVAKELMYGYEIDSRCCALGFSLDRFGIYSGLGPQGNL